MQINFSIQNIQDVASQFINEISPQKIVLFHGEMGAGKTTFIKALCACMGVDGQVSSPTFSIINEYQGKSGRIYHFDFYRLKTQTEALDMGYEEYFYSGDYCFIEWPEKIPDLLPESYASVHITVNADNSRQITLKKM